MNDCINIKNTCFRHRIASSRSCYFWNLFLTFLILFTFLWISCIYNLNSPLLVVVFPTLYTYITCKLGLACCKRNIIHKVLSTKVMQVWRGDLFSKRNTTLILHRACFIFISISHYFFSFWRYNFILSSKDGEHKIHFSTILFTTHHRIYGDAIVDTYTDLCIKDSVLVQKDHDIGKKVTFFFLWNSWHFFLKIYFCTNYNFLLSIEKLYFPDRIFFLTFSRWKSVV